MLSNHKQVYLGIEVRDTGSIRGRSVLATQHFTVGEKIVVDEPLLCCERSDDAETRFLEVLEAFDQAPADVKEQVIDLVPAIDESHPRVLAVRSFAASCTGFKMKASDILKAILAFECTAFEMQHSLATATTSRSRAVFPMMSKFNHSCSPNAAWYVSSPELGGSFVYAVRDISEGEEISISYLGWKALGSAVSRKKFLYDTHMFTCTCELCCADTDRLRRIPCPKCHPRCDGVLPDKVAHEEIDLAYAILELPTDLWRCSRCVSCWSVHEFFDSCGFSQAEENRIWEDVTKYVNAVSNDCFHDTPGTQQLSELRKLTTTTLGARHAASIYLELSALDHLVTSLNVISIQVPDVKQPKLGELLTEAGVYLGELAERTTKIVWRFKDSLEAEMFDIVVKLFWEYIWNAAVMLCSYRQYPEALPLFLLIEPYLTKVWTGALRTVGPPHGANMLASCIRKCRAPNDVKHGTHLLFHSDCDRVLMGGDLSHSEIEHFKVAANRMFMGKKFQIALLMYDGLRKSVPCIEAATVRTELEATLFSNAAQCSLNLHDFAGAEEHASCAISVAPNSKAFYRRALAREQLGNLDGACADAREALNLKANAEVKQLLARLQALACARPFRRK